MNRLAAPAFSLMLLILATQAFALAVNEPPDGKTYYGMGQDQASYASQWKAGVDGVAAQAHRLPRSFSQYIGVTGPNDVSQAVDAFRTVESQIGSDCYLLLAVHLGNVGAILSGSCDTKFQAWGAYLKTYPEPIWIRPLYEMGPDWGDAHDYLVSYQQSISQPTDETAVAALAQRLYKRVVDKVREGAGNSLPNVAWVWHVLPSAIPAWQFKYSQYYPGDNYVDWIGSSDYVRNQILVMFTLGAFATSHAKPVMIAESGASAIDKSTLPTGITSAGAVSTFLVPYFSAIENNANRIKAFVYNSVNFNDHDWVYSYMGDSRLELNPVALATFASHVAQDRYNFDAPQVGWSAPGNLEQVRGVITLRPTITGGWTPPQRVDFYVDNVKVGSATAAPYTLSWDSRTVTSNVRHELKAVAVAVPGYTVATSVQSVFPMNSGNVLLNPSFESGVTPNAVSWPDGWSAAPADWGPARFTTCLGTTANATQGSLAVRISAGIAGGGLYQTGIQPAQPTSMQFSADLTVASGTVDIWLYTWSPPFKYMVEYAYRSVAAAPGAQHITIPFATVICQGAPGLPAYDKVILQIVAGDTTTTLAPADFIVDNVVIAPAGVTSSAMQAAKASASAPALLTWTGSNPNGYLVYRNGVMLTSEPTLSTTYVDSAALADGMYLYEALPVCNGAAAGEGARLTTLSVGLAATTRVTQTVTPTAPLSTTVTVSRNVFVPGPGRSLVITVPQADPTTRIALYDLRGRQVGAWAAGDLRQDQIAWDGMEQGRFLPAGIYLVRVITGTEVQTRRVVLAK